jgi:prepilin-type N-terminal cleavage/methylation domain-containing protein
MENFLCYDSRGRCQKKGAPLPPGRRLGFTLVELMIVMVVIGILAIVAIPKFSNTIARSREASIKANLAAIRSALSIYYSNNDGEFPGDLGVLPMNVKYINKVPDVSIPNVPGNPGHDLVGLATAVDDGATGAWFYQPSGSQAGQVLVNCTHQDSAGRIWTSY